MRAKAGGRGYSPRVSTEEQYRTTYLEEFSAGHKELTLRAAGFPTDVTLGNSASLAGLPLGDAPIAPKAQSVPTSPSRRAIMSGRPRIFETTYKGAFNEANSTRSPLYKTRLAAGECPLSFPCSESPQSRGATLSQSGLHSFAARNTFRTTYNEKFADSSSIRALISSKACVDSDFRTPPLSGRPAWGFSERPPPYLPGPRWTFHADESSLTMCDRPVAETEFQYRTRNHETISSDAMLDATKKNPGTARRYTLFQTGHRPDRRHDFFSLDSKLTQRREREVSQDTASHDATAALFPKKKPNAKELFSSMRGADPLVFEEEPQAGRRAGLDFFSESVRKFEPNKARVDPGIPYCKPWQPLCTLHYDAPPQKFSFIAAKPKTSQSFVPVTPTARFDGRMAGLRRKGLQD